MTDNVGYPDFTLSHRYRSAMSDRNPEREAQAARLARRAETAAAWDQAEEAETTAPAAPSAPNPSVAVHSLGTADVARTDPTYAWTIAVLPIAWVPLAYLAPALAVSPLVLVGYFAITIALAILDSRQLRRAGIDVRTSTIGLVPWYLILRTKRAGSTPAIPVVWFAMAAASLLAQSTFAAVYQVDGNVLEPEIASWANEQGPAVSSVDCPSTWARQGDSVSCSVNFVNGTVAPVEVEVGDDGYFTWNWH